MRTRINLSSRPFTNRRVFWIVTVGVFLASISLLLWISAEKGRVIAKANEVRLRIDGQKLALEEAKREEDRRKKEQQKTVITEKETMQLAAARQLIDRKAFSWNKMLADIEQYVPKQTRIVSIKVDGVFNSTEDVTASVQVKAIGATPAEMTEMMANLDKSDGLFTVGETGQEAATDTGETPFTLNLTYKRSRGETQ